MVWFGYRAQPTPVVITNYHGSFEWSGKSKKAWSFLLLLVPVEKGGLFAGEVTVLRLDVWDEGERRDSFLTAYLES